MSKKHITDTDPESSKHLLQQQKSLDKDELQKILAEMPTAKETTCGFWCFGGSFLQRFANQTSYVIVYGLVGIVLSMSNSYFNASISTIEKRFKIPSRNTGMIMVGNDISQMFCSAFLGYYAGKKHRPRWMGFGVLLLIGFTMLTVTPHFIYGPGEDALRLTKEYTAMMDANLTQQDLETQSSKTLCRADGTGAECEIREGSLIPQILLFTAQFIAGVGGSFYYTLGIAYMDDNTEKSKAPALLSISFFLGLLGPSLGYTLGSICLRLYIAPYLTPLITNSDSRWLGAWWLGWLFITILIFCSGILMFMFPKELPITAARRKQKNLKAKKENMGKSIENLVVEPSWADMWKTFKNYLRNKTLIYNVTSNTFYCFGYMPYWIFAAKYIEIQYRQSAATSSIVTGTVALVFSAVAILLSGFLISKYKPRARYLASWNIFVDIVSMAGMIAYVFIGCSANDNSLIMNSNDSNSVLGSSLSCNSICYCDYVRYTPVCGEDQMTYISPCHAGCKKEHINAGEQKTYYDCSCISSMNSTLNINPLFQRITQEELNANTTNISKMLSLGDGGQAKDGACPINCNTEFIMFLAVMCIVKFVAATGRATNLLITMRAVPPEDKSAIMGFGTMLISLVCFIPAPIFYGWLFDSNCLVWGKTCTNNGNCWLYDSRNLRITINSVASVFLCLSTICNFGVWYHVKHLKVFDEHEDAVAATENPVSSKEINLLKLTDVVLAASRENLEKI